MSAAKISIFYKKNNNIYVLKMIAIGILIIISHSNIMVGKSYGPGTGLEIKLNIHV